MLPFLIKDKKMKIKINREMGVGGKHCKSGATVTVSDKDGRYLVNGGHAEEVKQKKADKKK